MAFSKAIKQWPRVQWPRRAYERHITQLFQQGTNPSYFLDLYLAGAAGHRLNPAWETIEQELGPQAKRVLMRKPKADFAVEDLWAETISNLIENDERHPQLSDGRFPAKIIRYQGLVQLLSFCITVALRIARDRNRKKKPRPIAEEAMESLKNNKVMSPDNDLLHQETLVRVTEILIQVMSHLSAEQRFLLRMVYGQGMQQKEAASILGISKFTAHRRIKDAIGSLRQAIQSLDLDRPAVAEPVWDAVWSSVWNQGIQSNREEGNVV